ncbi:MAG TPA: CehA/McbA family metallohydrolase, partial [Planctomycetota bacterium]|nr:CehA/McbA family metallohydrolase [Planctomycetota bacterium]
MDAARGGPVRNRRGTAEAGSSPDSPPLRTRTRILLLVLLLGGCASVNDAARTLSRSTYHLRSGGSPMWSDFADSPDGKRLDLPFEARANAVENTLFIRQEMVREKWPVLVNGTKIGELHKDETPLVGAYAVPPGLLKSGENILSIAPPAEKEDIRVGPVRLESRPLSEALGEASLQVTVVDPATNAALPCRLTIVDREGALAPIQAAPEPRIALRPGVLYTADGQANFSLPAGRYTVSATRGFEYGIDKHTVTLKPGGRAQFALRIRREVPTPGLAACDTHVHTLTLSGHGDCTLDERMVTLAGEGIELPVTTEHNVHRSYRDAASRVGVRDWFTPIDGNEVTTDVGHFNILPITGGEPAPWKSKDWSEILRGIRATPGVRVVILNHPRGRHSNFVPFHPANFNSASGRFLYPGDLAVDALELVNSGALRSDPMEVYRDWFALLNAGRRVLGVGSSDSHYVNYAIVGQGRTYIACDDRDPAKIDVNEVCENLLKGKALVSLGLLTRIRVNDRYGPGDLVTGVQGELKVEISVSGPTWTSVDRVELYANGIRIREEKIPASGGAGEKVKLDWRIPRPPQDAYLVAVATGPGVKDPAWPIPRPYQPSSAEFEPRVIGSTNPVWIDADGDGKYTSPHEWARTLIDRHGKAAEAIVPALAPYDEAVAVQAADLLLQS